MRKKIILAIFVYLSTNILAQEMNKNYILVENNNGPTLGYSSKSGVNIIEKDGLKFKDLNKNGKLEPYEDWRLSVEERATDLASKLSIDDIAGLMLYSDHQPIPANEIGVGAGTYNGLTLSKSKVANAWDLTDSQKEFLKDDNLRHILITSVKSPAIAAMWNNEMQAYVEGLGFGIPGNTSSDPRHSALATGNTKAEFNAGAGGEISSWPEGLGLAATFDPELVRQFGQIAAKEYRALGITTALSPQVDLGTEPRWYRISLTFGESPELSTDMSRAYIDGFQTSYGDAEIKDGWGYNSVNAMVKHWPSGGPEEGGRDGHWAFGKFAVYPGNNFETHLKPFAEGAFKLNGKTNKASAVMPYYTISYNQAEDGSNLGNGFSKYIITDLLRDKYGYDGVVCTDWMITHDEGATPGTFKGKPWGTEEKSVVERHYIALMAGVDQFGGNNEKQPILDAYAMGVKEHGEKFMRNRFEQSARRLLKNIFNLGLFENPYLSPKESAEIVGNPDFMQAGYDAQLKSIVLLKNEKNILPVKERKTVYIPRNYLPSVRDWWGNWNDQSLEYPIDMQMVKKYYNVTDKPSEADFAIVFITSPYSNSDGGGYEPNDRANGGNGYVPISLQYNTYTAKDAREHSIAAGDPVVDPTITNRSYKGKTVNVSNASDLSTVLTTKQRMGDKPTIVVANIARPMVFNEFESEVDGIIVRFGVGEQAVMDIISGKYEPSGLLPVQMPANMETVEKQNEDVPFDMDCHVDSEGNTYDFGYGLNWSGVIKDERTEKYVLKN